MANGSPEAGSLTTESAKHTEAGSDYLSRALNVLLDQGGAWAALTILSFVISGVLFRQLQKLNEARHDDAEKALKRAEEISDDRIKESNALAIALDRSTEANRALERTSAERVAAMNELTMGLRTMAAQIVVNEKTSGRAISDFNRRFDELFRAVQDNKELIRDRFPQPRGRT